MKWIDIKNELTQEKIRRRKAEKELKEAKKLITKLQGDIARFLNMGD